MQASWIAITTAPQKEFKVADDLARHDLTAFVPHEMRYRRLGGARVIYKPRKQPLCPRYVFVCGTGAPWRAIEDTKWITGVIMLHGRPVLIPDHHMDPLRMATAASEVSSHLRSVRVGSRVRLRRMGMLDIERDVIEIAKGKVKVILGLLGQGRPAWVPLADVEAA